MKTIIHTIREATEMLIYIMVFAALGSVAGYFIPRIFLEYFDNNPYYVIKNPIEIDKPLYKPCEKVIWTIEREATRSFNATGIIELVLIKDNAEVSRESQPLYVEEGKSIIHTASTLPCGLDEGVYKYQGIVYFTLNNVQHNTELYTKSFFVATASAEPAESL